MVNVDYKNALLRDRCRWTRLDSLQLPKEIVDMLFDNYGLVTLEHLLRLDSIMELTCIDLEQIQIIRDEISRLALTDRFQGIYESMYAPFYPISDAVKVMQQNWKDTEEAENENYISYEDAIYSKIVYAMVEYLNGLDAEILGGNKFPDDFNFVDRLSILWQHKRFEDIHPRLAEYIDEALFRAWESITSFEEDALIESVTDEEDEEGNYSLIERRINKRFEKYVLYTYYKCDKIQRFLNPTKK